MGGGESVLISPGEIYWIDLPSGTRPGIVVSREDLNRGNYIVVVLCTSAQLAKRANLPHCVSFSAGEFGLPKDCVAQCETICFVEVGSIDVAQGPMGTLDEARLRSIVKAIGHVIEADCDLE